MKRVVVTGMGIWSCIGQDLQTVTDSLRQGSSGIIYDPKRMEYGLQTGLVGNIPCPNLKQMIPRHFRLVMNEDTMYAYMALKQAIIQSDLSPERLKNEQIGILFGNDGNTCVTNYAKEMSQYHDSGMISAESIIRQSTSNCSFILSNMFGINGICSTISAACASSSHAIGIGKMYIQSGLYDLMIVGGSCELGIQFAAMADSIGALSRHDNDPTRASRPFDRNRDGMVSSGGAAALVLEEYEHAKARGVNILAEVCGYGFSSNGLEDITMPSADAEYIAMKRALDDAGLQPSDVDYVNAHATSTIIGDIEEAKALTRLFGNQPFISSTKSMTGHENWMAGASEAVYSILMMQNNFVAPNINLENVIEEAKDLNIVRETIYTPINTVLSNSSGMGGTNSALVFRKV